LYCAHTTTDSVICAGSVLGCWYDATSPGAFGATAVDEPAAAAV